MPAEKIPSNAFGYGGAKGVNPYWQNKLSQCQCAATYFEIPGRCFNIPPCGGHGCRSDGLNVSITAVLYVLRMINSFFTEIGRVPDQDS